MRGNSTGRREEINPQHFFSEFSVNSDGKKITFKMLLRKINIPNEKFRSRYFLVDTKRFTSPK